MRARCRRREFRSGTIGIAPARERGAREAAECVMGCHVVSCFRCRVIMCSGDSGHNAVGSGPASGFFSGAIRRRVRGMAFLLSTPVSFLSPAGDGTLIRAYPARARARVGAGAVCAPDCPGAPPRASRTQGARLPFLPRGSLRASAHAGSLRTTPAAILSGGERIRCQAEKRIISNISNNPGIVPGIPSATAEKTGRGDDRGLPP